MATEAPVVESTPQALVSQPVVKPTVSTPAVPAKVETTTSTVKGPTVAGNGITLDKLEHTLQVLGVAAKDINTYALAIYTEAAKVGWLTPERLAAMLGQVMVETYRLARTSENLYYTTISALRNAFGSRLGNNPEQYLRNPMKLANQVYSNMATLGNKGGTDGWDYRGSGMIQTTGRYNFLVLGTHIGVDLVKNPDLLRNDPNISAKAAFYFLAIQRKAAGAADKRDWDGVTKLVNPAMMDATTRAQYSRTAYKCLKA